MTTSERVEELKTLVAKYIDELGLKYLRDPKGDFLVPFGSGVRVHLVAQEFGSDRTVLQVIAPTNLGLKMTPELAIYVATESSKLLFGRLAFYPDQGAVGFEESLLGDFLNRAELEVAIGAASTIADNFDDEIKDRFGGEKAGRGF